MAKAFSRQRVLKDITLSLAPKEITVLLGANGAGKTTLLHILATMVRPESGEVRYDGRAADTQVRAQIGFVGHDSCCYGDLTARENLQLFARLYGLRDAKARADELLALVDLATAAHKVVRSFSRGMVQRLALARALVAKPSLLLLDEPFTGLDRSGVAILQRLLVSEAERGLITLLTTHDFSAVEPIATRVVGLARGHLRLDERGKSPSLAILYEKLGTGS